MSSDDEGKVINITSDHLRAAALKGAPTSEIIAELERRYPTFLLAYNHRPEGATRAATTVSQYSREGLDSDVLGLAHACVSAVERKIRNDFTDDQLPTLKKG